MLPRCSLLGHPDSNALADQVRQSCYRLCHLYVPVVDCAAIITFVFLVRENDWFPSLADDEVCSHSFVSDQSVPRFIAVFPIARIRHSRTCRRSLNSFLPESWQETHQLAISKRVQYLQVLTRSALSCDEKSESHNM